jgi:hypothetical protein
MMVKSCLLLIVGFLFLIPKGLLAKNKEKSNRDMMPTYKIGMTEALDSLARSGRIYIEPFHHGSLEVGVYAPKGDDQQKPHDKDKVYAVMSGEGVFFFAMEKVCL